MGLRPSEDEFEVPAYDDPCYDATGYVGLDYDEGNCGILAIYGGNGGSVGLNPAEWEICRHIWDGWKCLAASRAADEASDETFRRFPTTTRVDGADPSGSAGDDGSQANAFKHAFWNGMMVYEMGSSNAELLATAHERFTDFFDIDSFSGQWALAHKGMDMANNFYGRQLASRFVSSDSRSQFRSRLSDVVFTFVVDQNDACWIRNWQGGQSNREDPEYARPSRCGMG